jgi:uncharacterized membrane protein SirB2
MKNFLIILIIATVPFVSFSQEKEDNYYIKKIIRESAEKTERERTKRKAEVLPVLFVISGLLMLMGFSMFFAKNFWLNQIKIGNRFKGVKTEITHQTHLSLHITGTVLIVSGLWLIYFAQSL